jgi:hypothetical protein
VGQRWGNLGVDVLQKRKDVAKGPNPPCGSIVKGRRLILEVVNSWISMCPVATVACITTSKLHSLNSSDNSKRIPHVELGHLHI